MPQDAASELAEIVAPGKSYSLSGPAARIDGSRLPVRGDLAHIRLAGKVFVPHYVVPMPHLVHGRGAVLLSAGKPDADEVAQLPTGTVFNVLDMAGSWAWGQVGDDGAVGYVALDALDPLAQEAKP